MANSKKLSFDDGKFCETLHHSGCCKASKRLGHYPIGSQMQMNDLLDAFVELKHGEFAPQLGQTSGEWNEANRIINSYLKASMAKAGHPLPPQIGLEIGNAIQNWGRYKDLPKDMQTNIEKSKQTYVCLEASLSSRLFHFFNEMKVRIASLEDKEKPSIMVLINLYQPAIEKKCKETSIEGIHALLNQLDIDLTNLLDGHEGPSKAFKNLVIKTQQDMNDIRAFGEGKRGLGGKRAVKKPDKQNSGISRILEHMQAKKSWLSR
jgi:hypothetical protein